MITLRNYQNSKVGVIGFGKTGTATTASLLASGAEVYAWDDKVEGRTTLQHNASFSKAHLAEPSAWPWKELKALVLSPGVPYTYP